MMSFRFCLFVCVFVICFFTKVKCQESGDRCQHTASRQSGVCIAIAFCPSALEELRQSKRPQVCSFLDRVPIVCCRQNASEPSTATATSSTTFIPYNFTDPDICPAVPAMLVTTQKTGQKAWDKCIDLIDTVYTCVRSNPMLLVSEFERKDTCTFKGIGLIVGSFQATKGEFPHMALLGFGEQPETATWECSGTLISEKWVMTAAHCLLSEQRGNVKYVRLGAPNIEDPVENKNLYTIIQGVPHPEYSPRSAYNDIALLELDRAVVFKPTIRPACLHVGNPVNDNRLLATTWRVNRNAGDTKSNLIKVNLEKSSYEVCLEQFPNSRRLRDGVRNATQLCAAHRNTVRDSCQDDSGGPLQIHNDAVYCTYLVVGVASFGQACGNVNQPALYTRVSAFVPWIESVVWP